MEILKCRGFLVLGRARPFFSSFTHHEHIICHVGVRIGFLHPVDLSKVLLVSHIFAVN